MPVLRTHEHIFGHWKLLDVLNVQNKSLWISQLAWVALFGGEVVGNNAPCLSFEFVSNRITLCGINQILGNRNCGFVD